MRGCLICEVVLYARLSYMRGRLICEYLRYVYVLKTLVLTWALQLYTSRNDSFTIILLHVYYDWFKHILFRYKVHRKGLGVALSPTLPSPMIDYDCSARGC